MDTLRSHHKKCEERFNEAQVRKSKMKTSTLIDGSSKDQSTTDEEQPILSSAKASRKKRPSKTVTTRLDSGIECTSVGDEGEVLSIQSKSLIEKRTMSGVLEDYEDFEDDGDTDDEEARLTSLPKKPIQRRNTDKRHAKDDGDGEQFDGFGGQIKGTSSTKTRNEETEEDKSETNAYGHECCAIQSQCPAKRSKMTKPGNATESG
ncbi:hypothetical protein ATANTOWER_004481, partial [Ataeniobius toweri]|nr:hypothetical protein [Ataeniobius toweri]